MAHLGVEQLVAGDGGLAAREGAGLVKDDVPDLVGAFQGVGALDEDAVRGGHPRADHHSCGGGQAQGAGAGDHQDRDAKKRGKQEGVVPHGGPLRRVQLEDACHVPVEAQLRLGQMHVKWQANDASTAISKTFKVDPDPLRSTFLGRFLSSLHCIRKLWCAALLELKQDREP